MNHAPNLDQIPACGVLPETLNALLDGELPPREAADLRQHIAHCPACRAFCAEGERLNALLAALRPSPPPDLADRILAALPPREKQQIHPPHRALPYLSAAAAVCLLIGGLSLALPRALQKADAHAPAENGQLSVSSGSLIVNGFLTGDLPAAEPTAGENPTPAPPAGDTAPDTLRGGATELTKPDAAQPDAAETSAKYTLLFEERRYTLRELLDDPAALPAETVRRFAASAEAEAIAAGDTDAAALAAALLALVS